MTFFEFFSFFFFTNYKSDFIELLFYFSNKLNNISAVCNLRLNTRRYCHRCHASGAIIGQTQSDLVELHGLEDKESRCQCNSQRFWLRFRRVVSADRLQSRCHPTPTWQDPEICVRLLPVDSEAERAKAEAVEGVKSRRDKSDKRSYFPQRSPRSAGSDDSDEVTGGN